MTQLDYVVIHGIYFIPFCLINGSTLS